ncbi:hypothetical protein T01_15376 [Trichinella spiralis]|uniref:Uncharacterized protein n=1 Tax=Trichinella spiralis TaxID=6334 RepID=A0A0V1BQC7_TRISP|nr:hypothetical protein T01_15376 [Trichinella spiralis]
MDSRGIGVHDDNNVQICEIYTFYDKLRQHAHDGTVSPWHKIIKSEKRVQEFQVDTTVDIQLSLAINTFFEEINILDRNDDYNLKLLAKEREDKINE